ncbi:MAG: aminotransferase class III-fold pyridoxal phosphate-dependent enzyme [Candidatus Microthrix sp.]|nr:aminotransferase class III-fold pyridoxal phosphate-dependent enzyme [Candidatus Microthrix sp.]
MCNHNAVWDDQVEASHLSSIGEVARRNGALFVLDEMRSGFRVALGGAQQYLHVQADLAAYGKAMGNGHPISALVGRRDILSKLSDTKKFRQPTLLSPDPWQQLSRRSRSFVIRML